MRRLRRGARSLLLLAVLACAVTASATAAAEDGLRRGEREFFVVAAGLDPQPLRLAHEYVDAASVRVFVDGRVWSQGDDFKVRARSGVLVPLRAWRDTAGADEGPVLVIITYDFLPVPVTPRRDLRPLVLAPQGEAGSVTAPRPSAAADQDDWRPDNLKVSGSKTVQVSSGSRREMTVDQNLRLTLEGQLTRDISVRAFLSDDNLPVVPEGNTEELRDIDKVLVELKGRSWSAALGDFVAVRRHTEYGDYRRKLQGINVEAHPGAARLEALAGSPRGLYRTLQIRGQESNQGPYYLGGGSGGQRLFVVAGSERVTLDGQVLVRGADRDYVVDYVLGTVTFTYRRLITSESTIVVEFEEGEGPYGRTVVGGGGGAAFQVPLAGVPGDLGLRVIKEEDDPARLRTGDLGEDDEAILAAAGDDPLAAVAPGAVRTATGEGLYDQVTVDGRTAYVHNAAGGDWLLSLFYVGPGAGEYDLERISAGGDRIYIYRGPGLGSYLIGRPLALPGSQSMVTATAAFGDSARAHLAAEWDFSSADANLLSDLDDENNDGQALSLRGKVAEQALNLGGRNLGRAGLEAFYNSRQAAFRAFQLQKNIFDYDQWGLAERASRPGFLEEGEREAGGRLTWGAGTLGRGLQLTGRVGSLSHGTSTTADQAAAAATWSMAGGRGDHLFQGATAGDLIDPLDIRRYLSRHAVQWTLGTWRPSARYQLRHWSDAATGPGRAAGHRLETWGGGLAGSASSGLDWRLEFSRELSDSLRYDSWQREQDARTTTANLTTGRVGGMRLVGEGTLRRAEKPDGSQETTRLARLNLAGNWERSASDWSLGYRVDNSRAEVLDRQIIFVGEGNGDYNEDGDYLGPGQGDYDAIIAGTDSLVATTSVEADLQWRQGFRFLGADRWYGAWSLLTIGSVEGRSTSDDISGLLLLQPGVLFDRDAAVLTDVSLGQELSLLEHLRAVDLRGKFDYRETLDRQFATRPEERLGRNWEATGNLNVSAVSSVRLRWRQEDDSRESTEGASSARRSYSSRTRRYEGGFTWRPDPNLRLALQGEYLTRADAVSGVDQRETAVRPSGRHRFAGNWTVQAEVRLSDVTSEEPTGALRPWFFPQPGRNVESSLRLAWDPTEFLAVSATWFTRKQGEGRLQHDVRVETTARF